MECSIRKSRRALFFTIDALIAAMILIAGLLLMTSSYVSEQPKSMINTLASDMLNVLSELKVYEINNSYVALLIANGSIKDVNITVLQQIGEFWASGDAALAEEFALNVSEGMIPAKFGYSIVFDNDTVYTRTNAVRNSLVSAKKVITGIEKAKPIKGYVAKARATSVSKTTDLVVAFSPSGAGWKGSADDPGLVRVEKIFELPDVNILSAKAYLSFHLDRGSPNWDIVTINDGACAITRDQMDLAPGSEGVFRVFVLNASCFQAGNNSIRLDLRDLGYNAHIHPGTFFIINYNLTDAPELLSWEHSERIYFDNVLSVEGGSGQGSGPWSIVSFDIPANAMNISVAMQVAGRGVRDYTASCTPARRFYGWGGWRCMKDYDYIMFLNDDVPMDSDDNPSSGPLYAYSPAQTASRVVNGTNIISVYFNNFEDNVWGTGNETIYSDQINNASGSSYVEVNYTSPPALPYGVIEVRFVEEFGGVAAPTKDTNFSFPAETEGVSSVYVHPVEQYSYIAQVYSDTGYPPGNLVFESPSSRAVPSSVYIPLETLDLTPETLDFVRIRETTENDVLPNSTVDYGIYIRGFVGYGQVFATYAESIEDAIARLQEVLGSYVNASDILIENTTMSGVPSMWGPAVTEVRVWD